MTKTIYATATAPIKSGVAIIRVSGEAASLCIERFTGKKLPKARMANLAKIFDPVTKELIDSGLVLWFPGPNSFTGEDVAEFHVHGSQAVIKKMLQCLSAMQEVRLAQPGEFSQRAFENGKMDLVEAEGLADLIDAETTSQARQAIRQMQGEISCIYNNWREELITIQANLEAYIDFPDEEIPQDILDSFAADIEKLKSEIKKYLNDNNQGQRVRNGLYAVILGAPNVGKSSLINYIAKKDVAIISSIAGTTRDVIEVHLDINGHPVILADTAGLRKEAGLIEGQGIVKALERAATADIKIIMFSSEDFPDIDEESLRLIDTNSIVVINKMDKKKRVTPEILSKFLPVEISLTDKVGLEGLYDRIYNFGSSLFENNFDPLITRQRHRDLLQETLEHLENLNMTNEIELSAEDLRRAAFSLGKIIGKIGVEDILDKIFSSFCIGK